MRKLIAFTSLLFTAALLRADTIVPDSYTMSSPWPYGYSWATDPTLTLLTNGLYSSNFNPPGNLGGDQMVGSNNDREITFNFASSVTITNVTLHGVRWINAGVEIPALVTINGTDTFTYTQGDYADYARYTLSFNSTTGWTGSSLSLYAIANSTWMLFEEVTFTTGEGSTSVPDAGSSLLLCGMGLGALAFLRRRML